MTFEAFKEVFQFAHAHDDVPNGWWRHYMASTANYEILLRTNNLRGTVSHKKHGLVLHEASIVEIIDFLYMMGEN